ncbi:MAG TPA: pyruvate, phosphate dikinase [Ktedonobacteraceae bacterium]|nr:pyruvate, phosphate dikinase [Ktedonobacteraceae bacterium]
MARQHTGLQLDDVVERSPQKWVYLFNEGHAGMYDLLGVKGAGIAEMTNAGLPVPPGFTITTRACTAYYEESQQFPQGLWKQVLAALKTVEEQTGKHFGKKNNPLLVSVRSGAQFIMPGVMDTVLNLGMNDETVQGLVRLNGDERFVYDTYCRFIQMFSEVILNVEAGEFVRLLKQYKERAGARTEAEIPVADLKQLAEAFKQIAERRTRKPFPNDAYQQLQEAIEAVFSSWNNTGAINYRNFHKIAHTAGTAVTVQSMVFGNISSDSGTGVAYTRNPNTGKKELYGRYLPYAQGEEVMARTRNPLSLQSLEKNMPQVFQELQEIAQRLEQRYRDMQSLEFTVEKGRLYMLQTHSAYRTALVAVNVAIDMVEEGLISEEEAVLRIDPSQIEQLLLPRFDEAEKERARQEGRLLAKGVDASPGSASGKAVFDANRAEQLEKAGVDVVLVRPEATSDDVHGMIAARGILTVHGGATDQTAVIARGLGLPGVVGCHMIHVNEAEKFFQVVGSTRVVLEGDDISIDGLTGEVFAGTIEAVHPDFDREPGLQKLLSWADRFRKLGVRASIDHPRNLGRAVAFGAQGIGVCRTEHMFLEQERLPIVQRMILAENKQERQEALDRLLPFQRSDFKAIFEAMMNPETGEGYPVVIRLLDLPLHEFLPSYHELLVAVTRMETKGEHTPELAQKRKMLEAVAAVREANPMLGTRGCRLGLLFPEINIMQTRAILEAATELAKQGKKLQPQILIPLVTHVSELQEVRRQLEAVAKEITAEVGSTVEYKFGCMIELPRAALTADQIATVADFFSFGSNDLTQTTFGFSRDDAEDSFLLQYVKGLRVPGMRNRIQILPANPFHTLDIDGVGRLIQLAAEKGRRANPHLELGVSGLLTNDPESIKFFHDIGMDYVSCPPFSIPIARLAAAQAALSSAKKEQVLPGKGI